METRHSSCLSLSSGLQFPASPENYLNKPVTSSHRNQGLLHPLFFLFFFWPRCVACGILVPWPGIEPVPSAVKAPSLNHWTVREYPILLKLQSLPPTPLVVHSVPKCKPLVALCDMQCPPSGCKYMWQINCCLFQLSSVGCCVFGHPHNPRAVSLPQQWGEEEVINTIGVMNRMDQPWPRTLGQL